MNRLRAIRQVLLRLFAGALITACENKEAQAPFDTTQSLQQLMAQVIDPAAQGVWSHAGWIIDETGETSLEPTIEAEWAKAVSDAAMVAEGGNMLLLPGRIRVLAEDDNGDWVRFSNLLSQRAMAVKAATEARNVQAMFDAGGDLYQACIACHEKYYTPFLEAD